jgi:pyruvate,water dikinase
MTRKVADRTVAAVVSGKAHVRLPARFGAYHALNNAPRRMVQAALLGVRMPKLRVDREGDGPFEPIWATDNPPSRDWPLYTRGNVGEVFPEVVLPLTWNLFGQAAEDGWRAAYRKMGLLVGGDVADDEPMVILGVFGGYCYINASFVRMLGVRAPGATVEAIDTQFFGESDAPAYEASAGDKNLRSSLLLGRHILRLLRTKEVAGLQDDKTAARSYLDRCPGVDASDAVLMAYLRELTPLFEQLFARHIDNTFSVALLSGALADLLAKVDMSDRLVAILGGIGDVDSAAPSAAMWTLARAAAVDTAVSAAFDVGVTGLRDRLRGAADTAAWSADFDRFIDDFGSRGPNEWDLGSDPWEFRPELALAAIDRMRNASPDHDPSAQAARLAAERISAVAEIRRALKAPDRFQFDKALASTAL